MMARLKIAAFHCVLALCAWMVGADFCSGAKPYQPVFGDPMLERWRWRTFPELSGLDVQCMTEGSDGTMWFGTANGLWSYDGFEWIRHTAGVGRIVTTLSCQPNGVLYAGGGWGISQFAQGKWERLFSSTSSGRIADISDIPIRKIVTGRDGSLWVATSWGALHHEGSTWSLYTDPDTAALLRDNRSLSSSQIQVFPEPMLAKFRSGARNGGRCDFTEVCADKEGRIWIGTARGEVVSCGPTVGNAPHGEWAVYDEADGLFPGGVSSICPMRDGTIWVVHADSEFANVFDGHAWKSVRLPLALPALDIGDVGGKLIQTGDGVIWLSARYMLFAFRGGRWRKYEQPEIPYPSTRNVFVESAEGAIWFAGPNSEIFRVDYRTSRWQTLQDLNFQWESPTGAQWFLHRDGRIVVHESDRWTSYGVEDGLMDMPVALLGTRKGELWAVGSHDHIAATARFEGQQWSRTLHENVSFAFDWRGTFESSDGSLWFAAWVDTDGPAKHCDGILQYRDGVWIHHHQPGRSPRPDVPDDPATLLPASPNPDRPIEKFSCLGESRGGKIWAGRNILVVYDGKKWERYPTPADMHNGNLETMLTTAEGDLWVGTRESGAWRYDGQTWRQYQGKESLVANSVRSLAQTLDGSIWAVTDHGSSRFDGNTWMEDVLPEQLNFAHESGGLKASGSGQLWINHFTLYWMRRAWLKSPPPDPNGEFRTVSHQFRGQAPRTTITSGAETISQPGNLAVLWSGVMPWREHADARLQFSYRLDDQPWSAYTADRGHSFFTIPDGRHHLEVRARDADFNVDPTPAVLDFVVLPPVWRQSWFILLMFLLGGLIIFQSVRVLLEQGRLRRAHDELEARVRQRTAELEAANRELGAANRELEAFSYSVSHDLRTPLRSIDGFSRVLLKDYGPKLDEEGRGDLQRVRAAAQRMGQLIEDMLKLSRVTRGELRFVDVDLSMLVNEIARDLALHERERKVRFTIAPNVVVRGDGNLLRIALENLLGNAWKFTAKREQATIEFGVTEKEGERVFFVRDDGAGFDMTYVNKLFSAFQRLHTTTEFPGTGVGLAIVQRVILRHGGRVWAEGAVEGGATFFFTLGSDAQGT